MNTLVLMMETDSHKPMFAKDHGDFDSFQEPGEAKGLSPLPAGRVSFASTSDLSLQRGYELCLSGAGCGGNLPQSQGVRLHAHPKHTYHRYKSSLGSQDLGLNL